MRKNARSSPGTAAITASGAPQRISATAVEFPSLVRRMRPPESGTAMSEPMPEASIKRPTPALPARSSRREAITATAIHMPRTNVRSPLTVSNGATWGSLIASNVALVRSRKPLSWIAIGVGTSTWVNRVVTTAATISSVAAPPNTSAGGATLRRSPPLIPPSAWASVLTMLTPAADAASSLGVRASTGSNVD